MIETVAAPSKAPVLALGESGMGKEIVAHLIHRWSPRPANPFVAANFAGRPETLLESELFGHSNGAFTGAQAVQLGSFRCAQQGTLGLGEIGDLPLHLRPKRLPRRISVGRVRTDPFSARIGRECGIHSR